MTTKKVVVYPRGFAGFDVGWPIVRVETKLDSQVAVARYGAVSSRERNTVSAGNVEKLYDELMSNLRSPSSVEFIEELYAVATNAFGTTNFYEWLHMQTQNPYFTEDHRDFLNDTLEFIFGRVRQYSMGSWRQVVQQRMSPTGPIVKDYRYQQFFIGRAVNSTDIAEEMRVTTVIRKWMARPNGPEDLLSTLHILFGEV